MRSSGTITSTLSTGSTAGSLLSDRELRSSSGGGSGSGNSRRGSHTSLRTSDHRSASFTLEFQSSLVETNETKNKRWTLSKSVKIATLRQENVGFYGRDEQVAVLQDCYDRVSTTGSGGCGTTGTRELVLISGPSGTGKSRLAQHLWKTQQKRGNNKKQLDNNCNTTQGAFVMGKADQSAREEPYSSMVAACQILCQDLCQDSVLARKAQELLLDQLGWELLSYLSDLIPSLDSLMIWANPDTDTDGKEPEDKTNATPQPEQPNNQHQHSSSSSSSGQSSEAKHQQMNYAFRVFIRVLSSCFAPLVICLDDLQWSDAATLNLMELLLTDADLHQFMILGCYRSDEVQENSRLSQLLQSLEQQQKDTTSTSSELQSKCTVTQLQLGNLTVEDSNHVLMDLLTLEDPSTTFSLAAICHKRTLGNVHFLIQFAVMLQERELLKFNIGSFRWTWNVAAIEEETKAADNVISVVVERLQKLSKELLHFLAVAALIGSTTTLQILEIAWERTRRDDEQDAVVVDLIQTAVQGSFLEPCGYERYKFVHDKIQEAASLQLSEQERKREQFEIGMHLLDNFTEEEKQAEIFLIRDLLEAHSAIHSDINNWDPKERATVTSVNLLASERAKSVSAFQSSLTYARKGILLLSLTAWVDNYDTTLKLHCLAAEAAGFTGQSELLEKISKSVLRCSECRLVDKLRIYKVLMDKMANDGEQLEEATTLCISLLNQLGCSVPRSQAVVAMSAISSLLGFKRRPPTLEKLKALPKMTDWKRVECMYLLYRLQGYAYFAKNIMLSTWAAIKIAKMTLKHGRHEVSSTAFPALGMAMTGIFAEFQKGELFSFVGKLLVDMEENKSTEGRTLFTMVAANSYVKPMHDVMRPLMHGYKSSMQAGDTESAMFCLAHDCWLRFLAGGRPLPELEANCHRYLEQMKELHRANGIFFLAPVAVLVANLTGSGQKVGHYLEGKTSELLEDHAELVENVGCAYLGNYQKGADLSLQRGGAYDATYPAMPIGIWDKFLRGVCLYAAAINTGKRKYIQGANVIRKVISSWVKKGNPNSMHHASILDAEFNRMKKNWTEASKCYERAIAMAGRSGFLHDSALAEERYATHLLNPKGDFDKDNACLHMTNAIKLYSEWGASEKVRLLRQEIRGLLDEDDSAPAPFGQT
ncbi:Transcriptional regulator [Seminavis robusta]|uniref:Transcriptional regulator n=1 Tax=Seminavis robusta TaxID=568900 RepID=A0A9N8H072_9STRA|nr:Transcriptional regulator [Seminavis robusta]|eukprot:Sro15_g011360.1 Transcriptional regulator (1158) ;mRNA; r:150756-154338